MAARKLRAGKPWTPEIVRQRIRVGLLLKFMQDEALGKRELTPGQRESAKYLLSQGIGLPPQMTDINFKGQMEVNDISDKPLTAEEWAAQAAKPSEEDGES